MIKISVKNGWLKSPNVSEEKKLRYESRNKNWVSFLFDQWVSFLFEGISDSLNSSSKIKFDHVFVTFTLLRLIVQFAFILTKEMD